MKINLKASAKLVFLTLQNTAQLATKTANLLNVPLHRVRKRVFADNEVIVDIPCSVREKDVFLFQSTNNPANENLMELFITIDALTRSAAKSISLVIPYFGYARQDRKARGRQPITASLIANLISKLKIKRVITVDLHSPQIQGFFDIPVVHLSALPVLINHFLQRERTKFVLVAPDYGGHRRIQELNKYLDSYIAVIDKRRPIDNDIKVNFILGTVAQQNVLLIDDLIDTGNTMLKTLKFLKTKQAQKIYMIATHAVLSQNALARLAQAHQEQIFTRLFVSDSIYQPETTQHAAFLTVYSIADLLAQALTIIVTGGSVSALGMAHLNQLRVRNHVQ